MKERLNIYSPPTTLLRRAIGGKANARGKTPLWEKEPTLSRMLKAFQL
jgi:hypothetical protein